MIKLTLTGNHPYPMYVNPLHLVECYEQSNHVTQVRLMNGNGYSVQESVDAVHDQVIAWQHRTHQ
jgi:uncharacterized protein YlzI (FlbEa/FlbD family)